MQSLRLRILSRLDESGSKHFLQEILDQIPGTKELLRFLHRYTVFNGNFAGGVANLAGAFHVRQDLFRDSTDPVFHCADRSSEIASHIFFAAEDEYADRATGARVTHRQLAQALLREALAFYEIALTTFDANYTLAGALTHVLDGVKSGYRVDQSNSEDDIFRALGYHIGAELLADQEFNLIDRYLGDRHTALREYLRQRQTTHGLPAYHWIDLHTIVEEEHFDHAIIAAEKAVEYYVGDRPKPDVETAIVEGFVSFAEFQRQFFSEILN